MHESENTESVEAANTSNTVPVLSPFRHVSCQISRGSLVSILLVSISRKDPPTVVPCTVV